MVKADRAHKRGVCVLVIGFCLFSPAGHGAGAIKCWTDENGIRECGSAVPPEHSQKRVEVLNQQGRVVEVQAGAPTAEQRAAAAQRIRAAEAEQRRRQEQARLDRILLDTFVTPQDIERSREDKLTAVEGGIRLTEGNLERQRSNLERLTRRADGLEERGKKVPDDLQADLAELERQIRNNEAFIIAQRAEQDRIRRQHEEYLARFRELKGR